MTGRILIADGMSTNRITLKVRLETAHYRTLLATDAAQALSLARSQAPALILLDFTLPGGGVALCRQLRADPLTRHIPVVMLIAQEDRTKRIVAFHAGAEDTLSKPVHDPTLLAMVRGQIRRRSRPDPAAHGGGDIPDLVLAETAGTFTRPARLALITPDARRGIAWRQGLETVLRQDSLPLPCRSILVMAPGRALDPAETGHPPDAFVIASDFATRGDGLLLISDLRSRPESRDAVILMVDEADDPGLLPMALDLGATSVAHGPFDATEIAERLCVLVARKREDDAQREAFERHLSQALIDPLTGLHNRRYAESYLDRLAREAAHSGQPVAIMLADLDRFKSVNDSLGHVAGDEVLKQVARRLSTKIRSQDLLARWGGEEFLIAMPGTDLASARIAAERLRREVGDSVLFSREAGAQLSVTISIGVAVASLQGGGRPDIGAMTRAADRALYASKAEGRNQVTFSATLSAA